jgi:hypothetical protein
MIRSGRNRRSKQLCCALLRRAAGQFTNVSWVFAASINQTTRHSIPEDGHLHTHRREKLKFHLELKKLEFSFIYSGIYWAEI